MLRALKKLFGLGRGSEQLALDFSIPPKSADELRERLIELGLDERYRLRLTSNRTVFVSYSGEVVRVHRAYLAASEDVWEAMVVFVQAKRSGARNAARRTLLEFPIERTSDDDAKPKRASEKTYPDDDAMAERLAKTHSSMNEKRFGGELSAIPIRVSRRMKSRLGHYTHRSPSGESAEIAISRRHIRRHGWDAAVETLVHEMVHQWQDENGMTVDHGRVFRTKARAVGIRASARLSL